jgi:hypothetical protein
MSFELRATSKPLSLSALRSGRHCTRVSSCTRAASDEPLGLIFRLWIGVVAIEKKCDDLFEDFFADVHGAMHSIARLDPIDLADFELPRHRCGAIAKFDMQQVSAQHYCYAMKGVVVPRRGFSGREPLAAHKTVSAMMENLLIWSGRHRGNQRVLRKGSSSKVERP